MIGAILGDIVGSPYELLLMTRLFLREPILKTQFDVQYLLAEIVIR